MLYIAVYLWRVGLKRIVVYIMQYMSALAVWTPSQDYVCRNHIRVYKRLVTDEDLLFVCGTQATVQPQCRTVNVSAFVGLRPLYSHSVGQLM